MKLLKGDFSFSYSDVLRAVATGPELTRATFRKSAKSKILNVENAEKRCNFSKFLDFNSIFIMIIPDIIIFSCEFQFNFRFHFRRSTPPLPPQARRPPGGARLPPAAAARPAPPPACRRARRRRPRASRGPAARSRPSLRARSGASLFFCASLVITKLGKFCKFLAGSFSAVSKRKFARKYAFDSIFPALQDLHTSAPLQSQKFSKNWFENQQFP